MKYAFEKEDIQHELGNTLGGGGGLGRRCGYSVPLVDEVVLEIGDATVRIRLTALSWTLERVQTVNVTLCFLPQ